MKNDDTKSPKKKKAITKKAVNGGTKKKKTRKASEKTAARATRLKPDERVSIKKRLVAHFGASKVATAIEHITKKKDLDTFLLQWKKKLEQEIEAEERDVASYYEQIDEEYKRVGRPKSVFNFKEMEFLCSIGCTLDEIAGFFQCSKTTIQERIKDEFDGKTFTEYYEGFSQGIKVSLRRKQLAVALEGDVGMLKWLGVNILGQKNKLEFEGEVKVNSWVDLVNNLEPEKNVNNNKEKEDENNKM